MLNFKEKINYLNEQLSITNENYADSFKLDIVFFINDFNEQNQLLFFLNQLSSREEITKWINKLTSRIVMKFDKESESINDFIYDYIING
ncbi:hypothetical protein [Aureibaculum luteum]|uniref:hypothetical protein n=1 Tax=Aureibaculum luteum TaxID=1548456 RepID=UPI000E4DF1B1|nr:hypothetical protein [Aureibaculum luteum]